MAIISESTLIVRNDRIPTGEIDGELVALDLEQGDCFGMDRIGTLIWGMAAEPILASAIVDRLAAEHDVDRDQCRDDVLPFLADLADAGLMRVVEG